ncbi:MAG TPA: nuclear transport factor 2 family protein [Vicinamibacteria bacterium]|nr:nuclear transport factor 2 family protein [Vicinamibacteria bacterium]
MYSLILMALLGLAPQAAPSPAPPGSTELTAEVQRAIAAYNARDLSYYERVLDPRSVYVAEDGALISGRDRVLRVFGRIFAADPPRKLEISDLSVTPHGETGSALFRWTLSSGPDVRRGVTSVLYAREGGAWRPLLIQNTLSTHPPPPASPAAGASPAARPSPHH